jgi:hypothetical protein
MRRAIVLACVIFSLIGADENAVAPATAAADRHVQWTAQCDRSDGVGGIDDHRGPPLTSTTVSPMPGSDGLLSHIAGLLQVVLEPRSVKLTVAASARPSINATMITRMIARRRDRFMGGEQRLYADRSRA